MSKMYEQYQSHVPEGSSGNWRIERFTVSEEEASFQNVRASFSFSSSGQYIESGTYTRLMRGGTVVMSDTPSEIRDHIYFIYKANGNVLIGGLGLGVVVEACLEKDEVDHVTVIEISEDVIKLVGGYLKEKYGDRFTIIHADLLKWRPDKGQTWDCAWYDIWDNICTDNLPEITKIKRKMGRRTSFQEAWREEDLRYRKRQEKRQGW